MISTKAHGILKRHWKRNRVIVSADMDALAADIVEHYPACVMRSYASGTDCNTWLIPDEWNVRCGTLRSAARGTLIADYQAHPLHVIAYSEPFTGRVRRDELQQHLHCTARMRSQIPYHYRNQYEYRRREWGFCLSAEQAEMITEEEYDVEIVTERNPGNMRVLDWHIAGASTETLLVCAHTCHTAQVNDGLLNVVLALEIFEELAEQAARGRLQKSYRLIAGPEYFAAAAILASGLDLTTIRHGLYLDFMGIDAPLAVGASACGNATIDLLVALAFAELRLDYQSRPFRQVYGNDEPLYACPPYSIPFCQLGRREGMTIPAIKHNSADDLDHIHWASYSESGSLLRQIVAVHETNCVPCRKCNGMPYLYRYNLYADAQTQRELYDKIERLFFIMDGKKDSVSIAAELNMPYGQLGEYLRRLANEQLVELT